MSACSKEYAKALFLSFTNNEDRNSALGFLRSLSEAFTNEPSFLEKFKNKSINKSDSKKLLETLTEKTNVKDVMTNFFNLLVDKNRITEIQNIAKDFESEMDLENGVVRGLIRSAKAITNDERQNLETKFSAKLNKKVLLTSIIDEKVVAGVRVEVDAFTFDDTVETHIKNIKENINRSWN